VAAPAAAGIAQKRERAEVKDVFVPSTLTVTLPLRLMLPVLLTTVLVGLARLPRLNSYEQPEPEPKLTAPSVTVALAVAGTGPTSLHR